MKRYVDGYVLPVPEEKVEEYRKMAAEAGKVWMKHGALEFVESVGDDLTPDMGEVKIASFPDIMDTKPDETIMFSFIVFESREHRDEVNAKVMKELDPEDGKEHDMPFDMKRMAYGGFSSIVDYGN